MLLDTHMTNTTCLPTTLGPIGGAVPLKDSGPRCIHPICPNTVTDPTNRVCDDHYVGLDGRAYAR